MNHLELGQLESRAADTSPFENWVREVETMLGFDLDGTEWIDGYSLDGAFDAYKSRRSATAYAASVLLNIKRLSA